MLKKRQKVNRVTVKDLARDLGMSVSTVSRAFYPEAVIADNTRKKVLKRAEELGFRRNPFAQSLITKKTKIVGMVVSDLSNPFYPEIMMTITKLLQEAGMNVMLAVAEKSEKTDESVELLLSYQPDVIIIVATNLASHARQKCEDAGAPCIFFNRLSSDGKGFGVTCDNELGGHFAADYLIDLGRQKLAYVSALSTASTNVERSKGFIERAVSRGVASPIVIEAGKFSYEAGYKAGVEFSERKLNVTGIFCASDIVAMGFVEGVKQSHIFSVPDDISVVGFDNIEMSGWPSHNLTTISQPIESMMQATIQLAKDLTDKKDIMPTILRLPPGKIMERSTTAHLNGKS